MFYEGSDKCFRNSPHRLAKIDGFQIENFRRKWCSSAALYEGSDKCFRNSPHTEVGNQRLLMFFGLKNENVVSSTETNNFHFCRVCDNPGTNCRISNPSSVVTCSGVGHHTSEVSKRAPLYSVQKSILSDRLHFFSIMPFQSTPYFRSISFYARICMRVSTNVLGIPIIQRSEFSDFNNMCAEM